MYTMIFDSHTHSDNSSDATHSVMHICERAVAMKITGLCITDHCELRYYEQDQYRRRIEQSLFDVKKAKMAFRGRLSLSSGVELSDVLYDRKLTESILRSCPFDFVLLSQHNDKDGEDFYFKDFSNMPQEEIDRLMSEYFEYLAQAAKTGMYDSLAHLTYPVRYIEGKYHRDARLEKYDGIIEQIFKAVIENKKALEINTSGMFDGMNQMMPSQKYLRMYRDLGGKYVTVGSDAHVAENVGRGIDEALSMLRRCGYTHFTVFKQRSPLSIRIS